MNTTFIRPAFSKTLTGTFETTSEGVRVRAERHYHLVLPEELTEEDLRLYRLPPPL
jgi:hypothetical protein